MNYWFDWNAYENPCFYIVLLLLLLLLLRFFKLDLCYRLQTWYTPWGAHTSIFEEPFFLVWLELVPVLNGLTWNWTFTYSRSISALGLVILAVVTHFFLALLTKFGRLVSLAILGRYLIKLILILHRLFTSKLTHHEEIFCELFF